MNFFGMGPLELLVIVVIAFIIFGPEKMTEIMGGLGRAVREFRSMTSDLTGEFERTLSEVRETAEELQSSTREALTVEGLNPFEQPASPATITATQPGQTAGTVGDAPAVVSAAVRPTRSQGPAPTKADPLADFAVFGEPVPVTPPSSEPPVVAEPVAEAEVLAEEPGSDGVATTVAANGHLPGEGAPEATVTSELLVESPQNETTAAEAQPQKSPPEGDTPATEADSKAAHVA